MNDGAWHDVALTYNGSVINLYLDGTLEVLGNAFLDANVRVAGAHEVQNYVWVLGDSYLESTLLVGSTLSVQEAAHLTSTLSAVVGAAVPGHP